MASSVNPNLYYAGDSMSQGDLGKISNQGNHAYDNTIDIFNSCSRPSDLSPVSFPEREIDFFSYARDEEFDDALFEVEMEMCAEDFEEEDEEDDNFADEFNDRLAVDDLTASEGDEHDHMSESDNYYYDDAEMISDMETPALLDHDPFSYSPSTDDSESVRTIGSSPYSFPLSDKEIPTTDLANMTLV
ncbi:hypothetical protein Unana1_00904 [Umbelopsis nana]